MTQEQINRLTSSYFRMALLAELLNQEAKFFLPNCPRSDIKQVIKHMVDFYSHNTNKLKTNLSKGSVEQINNLLVRDSEKIAAIGTILEKLLLLDEEQVLSIEADFDEHVKISYSELLNEEK